MTLSVRLDEKTKRRLSRAARDRRISQSEIVRQAIDAFLNNGAANEGVSLYHKMKHLIGSVKGGPPDLSERHSEYFYEYLLDKKRKGRL
jgi:Ribbon-helix-helix protein, copG family